jgi:pyruvate kinase
MAREWPCAPTVGMTPQRGTALRVALPRGVHPVLCEEVVDPYCVYK